MTDCSQYMIWFDILGQHYTVKTELREVFEKCFNLKQKCFAATEISHAVFHNSDTKCLDHPNSYLQLFVH